MGDIFEYIADIVSEFGYLGIFIMMTIESSFIPFPSEIVMIPAGYLVHKGEMNAIIAVLCGIAGSLAGALINYFLALKLGREFLLKYGKYVLFKEKQLHQVEDFFSKHGEISTFVCRLLMVIRQYVSLPAGLAKMNLFRFCIFTSLGACIWVALLVAFGYQIGEISAQVAQFQNLDVQSLIHIFTHKDENPQLISEFKKIGYFSGIFVIIIVAIYAIVWKFVTRKK